MTDRPPHRAVPSSILTRRVSSQQQRVLHTFHGVGRSGVLAQGTGATADPHTVIETLTVSRLDAVGRRAHDRCASGRR